MSPAAVVIDLTVDPEVSDGRPPHEDHFPFLKLPGELRNRIYDLLFPECGAGPVICLWPSPLPPPFTSNIVSGGSQESPAYKTIDTAILMVNKEVGVEAASVYYAKRSFRFDSAQLATLFLTSRIFDSLRALEIEDVLPHQRRWPMVATLDKLSRAAKMRTIIIGTNVSLGELRSFRSFCNTARDSWLETLSALCKKEFSDKSSQSEKDEAGRLWEEKQAKSFPSTYIPQLIWDIGHPNYSKFTFHESIFHERKVSIVNLKEVANEKRKQKEELQMTSAL